MTDKQQTVLIVEDEVEAAELFAEMMRVNGFRTLKSYGSAAAIDLLVTELPDLVILDIMMPDISGLEVLRFMRREPNFKDTPVIIVSAKSMPADIKVGMEAGASMYLTKPVGYLELKQAVERLTAHA
jgi:DNA-binding response OmpR family regulator